MNVCCVWFIVSEIHKSCLGNQDISFWIQQLEKVIDEKPSNVIDREEIDEQEDDDIDIDMQGDGNDNNNGGIVDEKIGNDDVDG